MSIRRKSCRRNQFGPIRVPARLDIVSALREIGVEVQVDDGPQRLIDCEITKVEPLKQPSCEIFFMRPVYGNTKGRTEKG